MEIPKQIKDFKNIDTNDLLNPDFGSKNFDEIKSEFDESHILIMEMVQIAFEEDNFPSGLKTQVLNIVNQFNSHYNKIKTYSIDNDGAHQFRGRNQIINEFRNWYTWNYQGFDNSNKSRNFLTIYNACKNLSNQSMSKDQDTLKKYLKESKTAKTDIDTILSELRKKAAEETVVDYANIFKEQAEKYSSFQIKIKPWSERVFKIGTSQTWLIVGIVFIIGLVFAINFINEIFPFDENKSYKIEIIQLLTRFAFISFLIFLVTFCFKQYSISKHLFTINKHRQNTLDSYKLFLESVDRDDSTTRNALMMEVAKAIYEAGNTGYISNKNNQNSPSIIEMTRLVSEKK